MVTLARDPLLRFAVARILNNVIVGWQNTLCATGEPLFELKNQNMTGWNVTSVLGPQFGTLTTPYCWSAVTGLKTTV